MLLYLRQRGQIGLPVHFVGKAATFNLLYAFPLLLLADRDRLDRRRLARAHRLGIRLVGRRALLARRVLYAVQARSSSRAAPGGAPDDDRAGAAPSAARMRR